MNTFNHAETFWSPRFRRAIIATSLIAMLSPIISFSGEPTPATPVFGAGISFPKFTFAPAAALPGWNFRSSSGGVETDAEGWRTFHIRTSNAADGPVLKGRARFAEAPEGAILAQWRVVPTADVNLLETVSAAEIPAPIVAGGKAIVDGDIVPIALDGAKPHLFKAAVTNLALFGPGGAELLRAAFCRPTKILLQDGAFWGGSHLTLRLYLAEGPLAARAEYSLDVTLSMPSAGPLVLAPCKTVAIDLGPDWIPLAYNPWIEPGSALDFSTVLPHHAPAGKYGRVIAVGDHFEFEKLPGVPQRFYGVNLCGTANLPSSRETADRFAANIARIGYNSLRIHHHERNLVIENGNWREGLDDTNPDPAQWEKFDNLVAAAVSNGLYITTDLFVSRSHLIPWRAIGIDRDGCIKDTGQFKVLCAFWEPAYTNLCAWTRNFLGHVNPRTGRSLAEEPALATLALINEGNLGNWGGAFLRDLPGVQEAWRAWLAGHPDYDVPDTIPDSLYSNGGDSPSARHSTAFAIFLADTEVALFERLSSFVRDACGCRAPLSSLSCWYNPEQYQAARAHFDYVDDHFYVDHPRFLDIPWRLPSKCPNTNPVAGAAGGAQGVEWRRLMEKPFCLTEWNFSGPGRFRGVGGIATGALGALQDWSGMWRFAWSHGRAGIEHPGGRITYFDVNGDPLALAAERAALCLFLRRDIAPHHEARPVVMDAAVLRDPRHGAPGFPGSAQSLALGWKARVGTTFASRRADGEESPASAAGAQVNPSRVTHDKGTFLIATPRLAGGFSEDGVHEAGVLRFSLHDAAATVWATSLDGEPLATSRHILVTHLTDVQNSGIRYGDPNLTILLDWGKTPHLARRGAADISLAIAPGEWRVWRLDSTGRRLGEVPVAYAAATGRLDFTANTAIDPSAATLLYELARP